jgi:predicted nuclease with TOPRIM domain
MEPWVAHLRTGRQQGERIMREQIEGRLQELRHEYEAGAKLLSELQAKQGNIQATLTRISGAIQVLEEELAKAAQVGNCGIKVESMDAAVGGSGKPPASA